MFFTSCLSRCKQGLDFNGDGSISLDEVVKAGSDAVMYTKNLTEIMKSYVGLVGAVWNVDVSSFETVAIELSTHLDKARDVLGQIKNFPRLPKNNTELKAMIDTDRDGTLSAGEVDAFLLKTKNAFAQAADYCLKQDLDYKPVKACSDTLNKMIATLQIINQAAASAKSSASQAANEDQPAPAEMAEPSEPAENTATISRL